MSYPDSFSCKRPCKLNFDIFKDDITQEYQMNKIIDEFKLLTPKLKRKVTFSPSVKKNDGLCRHNQILDRHIYEIFAGLGKTGIFQQMVKSKNIREIQILYYDIVDLIERCSNSDKGNVPVIATGGGNSCFITQSMHLDPLKRHANYVLLKLNQLKANSKL